MKYYLALSALLSSLARAGHPSQPIEVIAYPTHAPVNTRAVYVVARGPAWDGGTIGLRLPENVTDIVIDADHSDCTQERVETGTLILCTAAPGVDSLMVTGRIGLGAHEMVIAGFSQDQHSHGYGEDMQYITGITTLYLPMVTQ